MVFFISCLEIIPNIELCKIKEYWSNALSPILKVIDCLEIQLADGIINSSQKINQIELSFITIQRDHTVSSGYSKFNLQVDSNQILVLNLVCVDGPLPLSPCPPRKTRCEVTNLDVCGVHLHAW